ncbi:MAG: PilC/PilY family type IV pilus protein, partial [Pseudomonadota bacterium]
FLYPGGYVYDLDNDGDVDETDGDWLVNWVRGYKDGVSVKKEWLLGAVDHSVPALMVPPSRPRWYYGTLITDSERTSFDTFVTDKAARQTLVFVGARDGMLHAFDGGKFRWDDNPDTAASENRGYFLWEGSPKAPNYGTGDELWAFIPNNLVSRFKNNLLKADDQSYVDASPALADVYINGAWKTVLICAEGNGGDTVFALDVTDPGNPIFLWEFADPDLFRSRSSPAVAKIGRILSGSTTKWAAFFVSGKTYDNTIYPSVYIIDISTGSVIQRVFLDAETNGVGGTPSGQPAIVDSDGNGYIDRVYIGTDKGYMYKINIPDDPDTARYSIGHCVINTDFTSGTTTVPSDRRYQPIYASPTVVVDNGFTDTGEIIYNVMVFFGTGDSPYFDEDINTQNTNYYFYAYNDHNEKGACDAGTVDLDWLLELPAGNRVWYSAFAAAGSIYFGTSTAETEDPCAAVEANANQGMLYAFSLSGTPRFSQQVGNVLASPIVEDEHLYFRTVDGLTSLGSGQYNNEVSVGGIGKSALSMWREIF